MSRDEIIFSCMQTVDNLVKKYNNHESDEDLQSVGMIAVVECVDRCLKENMSNLDEIQRRCNVWARNAILGEIYKQKIKYSDNPDDLSFVAGEDDMTELLVYLEQVLTPREKEMFELLLFGYTKDEIMKKLNIQKTVYYDHVKAIKEKINGKNT